MTPERGRTPARVLMDWIEANQVEVRGATPAMLVSVVQRALADWPTEPPPAEPPEADFLPADIAAQGQTAARADALIAGHHSQPGSPLTPGQVLVAWLRERGRTQAWLADRTQMTSQHVSQLCRGRISVTPATALRLENATGLQAEFWLHLSLFRQLAQERERWT